LNKTKPFQIPKQLVMQAYKLIKKNAGSAGIDQQTIDQFELKLADNLYKIWNRMSSGTYFPPPVKAVPIPKKSGGTRILGIPTVSDRIAQMVVKLAFEPEVEKIFLPDSYGYRPNKSALDAVGVTRKRCWQYNWVLEFDIKGLFDNIPHDLLMKAVKKHTNNKWILLYIERWLKAPMEQQPRTKGTPQGGVISPLLSNLFLHYTFDRWITTKYPQNKWCRYADDGLIHCQTEQQAQQILSELKERFAQCGLEIHPDKTRIVCCKGNYPNKQFDFLGYTFRQRYVKNRYGKYFQTITPAVSKASIKAMKSKIRKSNIRNRTQSELKDIAKEYNPILIGWIEYYGKYRKSDLYTVLRHFNMALVSWAMLKYTNSHRYKTRCINLMNKITKRQPNLFIHWKIGMRGLFA